MDDGLENKFRLATIAPLDRRMKRKHLAVYGFLLDWYHRKYGDALASVRHIVAQLKERDPAGIGLYTGDVHSALKDLEAWGYITADVGIGRRASRYVPVWLHGRSVHKTPNTTEDEISVRENQNTSVQETPNTTSDSVHKTPNEDPSTVTRLQDGVTGIDGDDCAPATPPLPVGLRATGAGGAQGGFEELWKTYFPKRGQGDKKKARSAYEALAPDADLHSSMLVSARAWFEAWQAQCKPEAPRKHLDTWLTGEHYDCEPPTAYKAKERKAKAPTKASNDNDPDETQAPDFTVHPDQPAEGTIEKVEDWTDPDDGAKALTIHYRTHSDELVEQFFVYESDNEREQLDGQEELRTVLDAVSLDGIDSAKELIGRKVDLMINNGKFVSCSKPWVPAPKEPRVQVRFADVVKNTPFGGWSKMIGTAPMDD